VHIEAQTHASNEGDYTPEMKKNGDYTRHESKSLCDDS
jgi:hypothetical protein